MSKNTYLLLLALLVISCQAQSTITTGCRFANETACLSCMDRYYMASNGSCLAVSPTCAGYSTTTGLCTSCGAGYVLDNGRCVVPPSTSPILPAAILPNCAKTDTAGTDCTECSPNYSLYQGKCYNAIANCSSYSADGSCSQCVTDFSLIQGKCIKIIPNCAAYFVDDGSCGQCASGFNLIEGKCFPTIANCSSYSADGSCSHCLLDFSLIQGRCIKTIANCAAYFVDDGSCGQCSTNYTLLLGKCVKTAPNCESYNADTGNCSQCLAGYTLLDTKCYKIIPDCVAYFVESEKCFKCASNFEIVNGGDSCTPINISNISNCASLNGSQCSKCFDGFLLTSLNTCVVKAISCIKYSPEGVCLACDGNGTLVLVGGLCQLVISTVNKLGSSGNVTDTSFIDIHCNTFDAQGKCIKCSRGAYFNANNSCILGDLNCKNLSSTGVCY